MRRIALAAAVILATMAGGCTLSARSDDGRTVIRFANGPDHGNFIHHRIAEFEALHPDIRVDMLEMPAASDTEHNQYATYLIAEDSSIDVYAVDVIWPAEFGAAGWAEPLEGRLPQDDWKHFLNGALAACQSDGHIWAVPWYVNAGVLYYRKDLLDRAGLQPPQTWDELVTDCQKLQQPPDLYGYLGQWKQYEGLVCNFLEFIWGNGGDVLSPDGRVVVDSAQNLEALQTMCDLRNKYQVTAPDINISQEDESLNLFMAGKGVFLREWPYTWAILQKSPASHVAGKVGITRVPHGPHGSWAASTGGWNLMLSHYSQHKAQAWAFIDFMTSTHTQAEMVLEAAFMPTREPVYGDPRVLAAMPEVAKFHECFEWARPRPVTPYYSQISDMLQADVSRAINGQTTPAQALRQAQSDIESRPGLARHDLP
ncbi:MAG TPA: ABC transporter substrate-binding protein [Candidatus Xenobia bacterium]|jgi:multiple sugar transport system substrate-binding protein